MHAPKTSSSKPTVKRGSRPYIFHIESRTRPGRFYVTDAHRLTCTCEAGQRERGCWHLHLAVQYYAWWKHMQSTHQQQQPAAQAPAVLGVPQQTSQLVALSSYFEERRRGR